METVHTITNEEIAKTAQKQCEKHVWHVLNEHEIACKVCPTVNIVENAYEYETES